MDLISAISLFLELTAAILGLFVYKRSALPFRVFTLYLLVGFLNDVVNQYLYHYRLLPDLRRILFNGFSLFEGLCFVWFIASLSTLKFWRSNRISLLITTALAWLVITVICPRFLPNAILYIDGLFELAYMLFVSVFSTLFILKRLEKAGKVSEDPAFWFAFSLFAYCFCIFILFVFKNSEIIGQIWYVHNLVVIATYILYIIGYRTLLENLKKETVA